MTDRLARFTREAQTLASLNHANIAHLHGLESSGAVRALVMELVEGQDLSDVIARGRVPLPDTLSIARQLVDALEAAHEQGVVHRDLKPANIKVARGRVVKVLDFGRRSANDRAGQPAVPTARVCRLLAEQASSAPPLYVDCQRAATRDKRTDIWAFRRAMHAERTPMFGGETLTTCWLRVDA